MDSIADLLSRICNAKRAEHRYIDVAWSKMKEEIVKILKSEGFIAHLLVKEEKKKKTMRIFLKYGAGRQSVIQAMKRVSRPSLRRYISSRDIPRVLGGMGIAIMSTPQGVLEGEKARALKAGGELLCLVW